MRHDSYLPASPATLQALGRMEYAIVNTIAPPDVKIIGPHFKLMWTYIWRVRASVCMCMSASQLTNLCVFLTCGWTYWTYSTPRAVVNRVFSGGHCLLGGKAVPWSQVAS